MDVRKIGLTVPVSQELVDSVRDFRAGLERWNQMSPEERDELTQQRIRERGVERSGPKVELTLDTVISKLGWTKEYARHFVQTYCYCSDGMDGWEFCEHARDEGLTDY